MAPATAPTPPVATLRWAKVVAGVYRAEATDGAYVAYGDCVSADIGRTEWRVTFEQAGLDTRVGYTATLKAAKVAAQSHRGDRSCDA